MFHGDVFDQSGHRLISNYEQEKLAAKKKGVDIVQVCDSTEMLSVVPPRTCIGPIDARGDNMVLDYKLPPGVYYVFPGSGNEPLFTSKVS